MTEQAVSPLRRRMIEDMMIRKFAQKTQHDYVQRVKDFAKFLGRFPDTAKTEDVRGFQLHLTSSGPQALATNGRTHVPRGPVPCCGRVGSCGAPRRADQFGVKPVVVHGQSLPRHQDRE